MKLLILGSAGMAGHTISHYLDEQGHNVTGLDRKRNKCSSHGFRQIIGM